MKISSSFSGNRRFIIVTHKKVSIFDIYTVQIDMAFQKFGLKKLMRV